MIYPPRCNKFTVRTIKCQYVFYKNGSILSIQDLILLTILLGLRFKSLDRNVSLQQRTKNTHFFYLVVSCCLVLSCCVLCCVALIVSCCILCLNLCEILLISFHIFNYCLFGKFSARWLLIVCECIYFVIPPFVKSVFSHFILPTGDIKQVRHLH